MCALGPQVGGPQGGGLHLEMGVCRRDEGEMRSLGGPWSHRMRGPSKERRGGHRHPQRDARPRAQQTGSQPDAPLGVRTLSLDAGPP